MNELELTALDGANPLAFLAALGTLAILSENDPHLKLGWHARARWTPFLVSPEPLAETGILQRLGERLRGQAVDAKAERKREASQKRFDAAKKRLKDVNDDLKALKLKGNQLKAERERMVEPVRQRFEKRRNILLARLKSAVPSPELALGQRPDCTIQEFRQHALALRADATLSKRTTVDLLASFGAEIAGKENERIQPTPFCFITGSGHQWFLDTARQLMAEATDDKLREALFLPWGYTDEKLSMRWDPLDDRRYALMNRDPTAADNKSTTVWMANLLGYFALALFPCAALARGPAAACWSTDNDSPSFRWPLWEHPLRSEAIRSLLTHRALAAPSHEGGRDDLRAELRNRGVAAVFSARRIQVGNPPLHKINFSPATTCGFREAWPERAHFGLGLFVPVLSPAHHW